MWRTEDGRVHTAALPDPTELFTSGALAALRAFFDGEDAGAVEELLESVHEDAIDASVEPPFNADEEEAFVAETPLVDLFSAQIGTEAELRAALSALDWRWRLDIVTAMGDLTDA